MTTELTKMPESADGGAARTEPGRNGAPQVPRRPGSWHEDLRREALQIPEGRRSRPVFAVSV
jgi:hypothetical protein